MNIGRLDRRVQIQRLGDDRNNLGEIDSSWSTIATVWGRIELGSGSESVGDQLVSSTASGTLTIRYGSDVTPSDRVVVNNEAGGEAFSVLAVRELDRRDGLVLDIERVEGRPNVVSDE